MTALELYDATLIELNKVNAPTFTIEQWVYFANKAIQAFTDRRYNFYATNQQLTDDLRVLLSTYRAFNPDITSVDTDQKVEYFQIKEVDDREVINELYIDDVSRFKVEDRILIEGFDTRVYTITKIELAPNPKFPDWDVIGIAPYIFMAFSGSSGSNTDPISDFADSISIGVGAESAEDKAKRLFHSPILKVYNSYQTNESLSGNTIYSFNLETNDYYHMLAVRTYWTDKRSAAVTNSLYCDYNKVRSVSSMYPAKRLTYDMLANIENNAYSKPMYRQPYHQLHDNYLNVGTEKIINAIGEYQNMPLIEVHAGKIPEGITLQMIDVDYLKLPEVIHLTDEEVYTNVKDESQLLEWPDYLNSELISTLVSYFLENATNPRIQSFPTLQQDTPQVPLELGGQQ